MTTIAHDEPCRVTGGVDTHKDLHVAAVLDELGRQLGTESFPTTRHGYRRLLRWLRSHGELVAVGIEGCGSWGAGLARFLAARGVRVRGEPAQPAEPPAAGQVRHRGCRSRRPGRHQRPVHRHPEGGHGAGGGGPPAAYRPLRGHEGPHGGGQPAPQPVRHRPRVDPLSAGRPHPEEEG